VNFGYLENGQKNGKGPDVSGGAAGPLPMYGLAASRSIRVPAGYPQKFTGFLAVFKLSG